MIISIKHYDNKYIVELPDGSDIHEVISCLLSMVLVSGFSKDTIMDGIACYIQEQELTDNQNE